MAKQRGIHQIKGKINNLCYYEQKYVRGGLIRRINEAMSERLKTDPVFSRTRSANKVFGGCSMYAKALLSFFGSRTTFMFRPSRHAMLTKLVLEYMTSPDPIIGTSSIEASNIPVGSLPGLLDRVMKNPLSVDFSCIPRTFFGVSLGQTTTFTLPSDVLSDYIIKYNAEGVQVIISKAHYIYSINYDAETGKYTPPDMNPGGRGNTYVWSPGEGDLELVFSNGDVDDTTLFWIIYILPVVDTIGSRVVTRQTGATCGIIQFAM